MSHNIFPSQWLNNQASHKRQLMLVVNPMATPDPVTALFAAAPIRDYLKLYQGTEFHDLAALGPWLVRIDASAMTVVRDLIGAAQTHWGWIASAEQLDLNEVAAHWRARMVIRENNQRWFYRFQDNRVIARHLQALGQDQLPLLLGPLSSALCWDGRHWLGIDNPRPGLVPEPFDTPWLEILAQPAHTTETLRHQLEDWLFENHPEATQQLLNREPLVPWLQAQLDKANNWGWFSREQVHFLLEHQLSADLSNHPAWTPRVEETSEAHFLRAMREVSHASKGVRA